MRTLTALLLAVTLLAVGCRPGARPVAEIDWVDFVKLRGVTYTADYRQEATLTEENLGPVFGSVRYRVSGNVTDPEYRTKEGDATFLEKGTPVYTVKGYDPRFRVAARRDRRIILYEVDVNPRARVGANLFDLEGKVASIRIGDLKEDRMLAEIRDPGQVKALVAETLKAPALPEKEGSRRRQGDQYFITFIHANGTTSRRAFWPETGLLAAGYGLQMPHPFTSAILQSLQKAGTEEKPRGPKQCGTENWTQQGSFNAQGRQCLLEAYAAGQTAIFEITFPTTEGDPIIQHISVGAGKVQVSIDTTNDKFSAKQDRKVTTYACNTMEGEPRTHGELRLRLKKCTGGEGEELLL